MDVFSIDKSIENGRKSNSIRLEQALSLIGYGKFHHNMSVLLGFLLLALFSQIIIMAYIVPAIECDIPITATQKGLLSSISYAGMMTSSHLFGFLSDNYGRLNVMIKCCAITGLLCMVSSLSFNYIMITLIWFFNGFMIAGVVTPAYVYMCEFTPVKNRAQILLVTASIASFSAILDPCLSWLILPLQFQLELWSDLKFNSWRLLLVITALPSFVAAGLLLFLPKSPKFLLCQGKKNECLIILKQMYKTNQSSNSQNFPAEEIVLDENDLIQETINNNTIIGFMKSVWYQTRILFTPPLLKFTFLSCALQFAAIGTYNTISLWLPEIINKMSFQKVNHLTYNKTLCELLSESGSMRTIMSELEYNSNNVIQKSCNSPINAEMFLINIIIGTVQFLAFASTSKISYFLGQRATIVTFMLIPSLCSFFITEVRSFVVINILIGTLLVLVGSTLPISLGIVVDFFPTYVRSMATSISMIFGRLGATVGSQLFGYFQETHCDSIFYFLTGVQIGICILCTLIPIR